MSDGSENAPDGSRAGRDGVQALDEAIDLDEPESAAFAEAVSRELATDGSFDVASALDPTAPVFDREGVATTATNVAHMLRELVARDEVPVDELRPDDVYPLLGRFDRERAAYDQFDEELDLDGAWWRVGRIECRVPMAAVERVAERVAAELEGGSRVDVDHVFGDGVLDERDIPPTALPRIVDRLFDGNDVQRDAPSGGELLSVVRRAHAGTERADTDMGKLYGRFDDQLDVSDARWEVAGVGQISVDTGARIGAALALDERDEIPPKDALNDAIDEATARDVSIGVHARVAGVLRDAFDVGRDDGAGAGDADGERVR